MASNKCPGCRRVMSTREAAEQGMCNDCHPGGAYGGDEEQRYPEWLEREL